VTTAPGPPDLSTTAGQQWLREHGPKPRPQPDALTRPYWEAAAAHRLCIMQCADCATFRHPPTEDCPACSSARVVWTELSGSGTIYSFIIDRRNMVPGFDGPYVVAVVTPDETDDDVRLVSNIIGCAMEDVSIGMPVEVIYEDLDGGVTLPQFTPRRRTGLL
jgi:uncharacterized OB-fold protein